MSKRNPIARSFGSGVNKPQVIPDKTKEHGVKHKGEAFEDDAEGDHLSAGAAIQEMIDTYAIAGANLLDWLSEEDREAMPTSKNKREWSEWGSDVACRAAFRVLRQAKERITTPRIESLEAENARLKAQLAEMREALERINGVEMARIVNAACDEPDADLVWVLDIVHDELRTALAALEASDA